MSVEDWIDDNVDPDNYLTMQPLTVQRQQLWYTKTGDTIKICDMTDKQLMSEFNKSGDTTLFKEMVFRLFKRRVTEEDNI